MTYYPTTNRPTSGRIPFCHSRCFLQQCKSVNFWIFRVFVLEWTTFQELGSALYSFKLISFQLPKRKTRGELSIAFELSHIKEAALVYRLYCDVPKEIQTWELLYSAAVSLQDVHRAVDGMYFNVLSLVKDRKEEWMNMLQEKQTLSTLFTTNLMTDSYSRICEQWCTLRGGRIPKYLSSCWFFSGC